MIMLNTQPLSTQTSSWSLGNRQYHDSVSAAPGGIAVLGRLMAETVRFSLTSSLATAYVERFGRTPQPPTAASLLEFAGAWSGDDLNERLDEVYALRGETRP